MKKILMILSNISVIDKRITAGVSADEFEMIYSKFKETGYSFDIASPNGGRVSVDDQRTNTIKFSDIDYREYEALIIPGGAGCMFDLPDNQYLAKLIEDFKHTRKVIAAAGYGVSGLTGAKLTRGEPYVTGKALTATTDEETKLLGLEKYLPFSLENKLKELGANFMSKPSGESFVLEDNYLITAQNSDSVEEFIKTVSEKLERLNQKHHFDDV